MAQYPALPLFTDAYMADTRHLTAAQHGAYLLLLMTAWRMPDCKLPNDDRFLARCASMDLRTWKANKEVVLSFWKLDDQQKFRQDRLLDERKYVDDMRSKNSEAGKASALKRLNRDSTNVQPNPNVNPTPTPTPTPNIDISVAKATSPPKADYSSDFEDFWSRYPQNGASKKSSFQSYNRAVKEGAEHETIIRGVAAYTGYAERTGTPIAHATTWLNQQRWTVDYDNLTDRTRSVGQHKADSPNDRMGRAWAQAAGINTGGQND